jgi:hypothetical protein
MKSGDQMKNRIAVGSLAILLAVGGLALVAEPARAESPPPVITLSVVGDQAQVSQPTVRPGIVELGVGRTFRIPGPEARPDLLSVIRTDQLDAIAAALPAVFTESDDPAAAAAAAQAMRTIRTAGTFYGGGGRGTTWRVNLTPGTYTVTGVESLAMGLAKPVTFTVAGERRAGALPPTQATVRAVGPVGDNRWVFRQSDAPVEWIRFTNASKELHFLDMAGVKAGTTTAMVKKAFSSPKEPTFFTNKGISFDVVSPGVSVAIQAPASPGGYLLTCFIPSESDGMPHALMGMWKLVSVR